MLLYMETYTINMKIIGKARPRQGRGKHFYTPKRTQQAENEIRKTIQPMAIKHEGAVALTISFYFLKPKKITHKYSTEYPTKKPDIDNTIKLILDALNNIVYHDDVQVVDLVTKKRYGEVEQIEIIVEDVCATQEI